MKAITLTQPWATLWTSPRLADGRRPKRIESRNWRPESSGLPIDPGRTTLAVHAAKNITPAMRRRISDLDRFRDPYASELRACGYSDRDPWNRDYLELVNRDRAYDPEADLSGRKILPLASAVGYVVLSHVMTGTQVLRRHESGASVPLPGFSHFYVDELEVALGFYDEIEEQRYGWVSSAGFPLIAPVPCRGHQKFWDAPSEVANEIQSHFYSLPTQTATRSAHA